VHFTWDINIGHVIELCSLVMLIVGMHMKNIKDMQDIKTKINLMFKWFENHIIRSPK
jgi:hypothetical protein